MGRSIEGAFHPEFQLARQRWNPRNVEGDGEVCEGKFGDSASPDSSSGAHGIIEGRQEGE